MISNKAEYRYIICRDMFEIYHPNEQYSIREILKEYKTKPTEPTPITYIYDLESAKEDFRKFFIENDLKSRYSNGLHDEVLCNFNILVLYDRDWEIKAFAARCTEHNMGTEKDIIFL